MPTYEYQCSACGHKWDKFQSIKADPIKVCPHCGKRTAQRLIGTGAGIIFKGSGFYETDYRSQAYKDRAKSDSDSAKPAASTAATETTSAPSTSDAPKPVVEPKPAAPEKPAPAPTAKNSSAKPATGKPRK